MTKGATRNRGEKDRTVRTRSQLREPQRTQERGVKGSAKAQSQSQVAVRSRKSQFAVRSTQSQVTQVIAAASQTLTLEGNECLLLSKCRRVYIQRSATTFRAIPNISETTYSTFRPVPAPTELTHTEEPPPCGLRRIGTGGRVGESTSDVSSKRTSRRRTASIRIFGKSRRSGASSPDGEVAISCVDWSQRIRVLPMTGRVPLSRHVRTPWGAESIGRSRATDWEFESVVRARTASCVESPSRMTSQRGESGLFGNRSGITDRSGFGVASNRSC